MYRFRVTEKTHQIRPALSRERVLRAACEIADAEGIAALSMRRIGRAVGVEAMSLYTHIASKEDLLNGLTEMVAAEVQLPTEWYDWKAAVFAVAMETNAALRRHPWAGQLWATRTQLGPKRAAIMNGLLRGLGMAGMPPRLVHRAFHVLENHIIGYALRASSFPLSAAELPGAADRVLTEFRPEAFPELAQHIREHQNPDFTAAQGDSEFRFGLDLILAGLAAHHPAG